LQITGFPQKFSEGNCGITEAEKNWLLLDDEAVKVSSPDDID
jgi:hypothetical protein